ncbi:MAG: TlpA family protein disulfide reductase [Xanthomonadales bacterium]|nr:TlpA family protein disulfide reductase [Xanthomonadales bacterium]
MSRPRVSTWIVIAAFVLAAVAWLGGGLMTPLAARSQALNTVLNTPPGRWLQQSLLRADAPPAPKGMRVLVLGDHRVEFQLTDVDGQSQALSQWDGKLILMNFWATWCAPCRQEMPLLDAAQQRYASHGVQIIGIAIDQPQAVKSWLTQHPSSYPILIADSGSDPTLLYGDTRGALPYSVLIGRDGRLLATHLGALDEMQLKQWLAQPTTMHSTPDN